MWVISIQTDVFYVTNSLFSPMTLYHITRSREATDLLHRFGMGISYTDIRLLKNTWAKDITQNYKMILKKQFSNRKSVHISFDNSDGKQQTQFTTQPTIQLVRSFQPNNVRNKNEAFYLEEFDFGNGIKEGEINYGAYKIPRKSDQFADSSLLTASLHQDIAWWIVNTVGTDCLQDLGFEYEK